MNWKDICQRKKYKCPRNTRRNAQLSLTKNEIQIKTLAFTLLQSEWLSSITQTKTNVDQDVGGKETLIHSW
jgi:hypothetical protein